MLWLALAEGFHALLLRMSLFRDARIQTCCAHPPPGFVCSTSWSEWCLLEAAPAPLRAGLVSATGERHVLPHYIYLHRRGGRFVRVHHNNGSVMHTRFGAPHVLSSQPPVRLVSGAEPSLLPSSRQNNASFAHLTKVSAVTPIMPSTLVQRAGLHLVPASNPYVD